jgi:hypothetical protein
MLRIAQDEKIELKIKLEKEMAQVDFSDFFTSDDLVNQDLSDFLRFDEYSRSFVDSVLDNIPVTMVLFLIEGEKEIPGLEESETEPYLITKAITFIGSPEYLVDRSMLGLPDYLKLDWNHAKISKTQTLLSPSAIRKIIDGAPVTIRFHQREERPARYLSPVEIMIGDLKSGSNSGLETYIINPDELTATYEYSSLIRSEVEIGNVDGLGVLINGSLNQSGDSEEFYIGLS